jgi:Subtilase family
MSALSTELVLQAMAAMPEVEVVRRLRSGASTLSDGGSAAAGDIIVAHMAEQQAETLRHNAAPNVVIEPDETLQIANPPPAEAIRFDLGGKSVHWPCRKREIVFSVVVGHDRPVPGAEVFAFDSGFPAEAVTDASGRAVVAFYDPQNDAPDGLAGVTAIYVRPAADCWDYFIRNPALVDGPNLVRLRPLNEPSPNSASTAPHEPSLGWGRRIIQLDRLADSLDGAGVEIGLIDSGCDNAHPLLAHVTHGADLVDPGKANGWTFDPIGHGTHCAGIIATASNLPTQASRPRGIAPGAELHVFKVFPGGHCSDLIDTLDQCIERQLDIVAINIACDSVSEIAAQKFVEARQRGIACIGGGLHRWGLHRRGRQPLLSAASRRRGRSARRGSRSSRPSRAAVLRRATAPPRQPRTSSALPLCCWRTTRCFGRSMRRGASRASQPSSKRSGRPATRRICGRVWQIFGTCRNGPFSRGSRIAAMRPRRRLRRPHLRSPQGAVVLPACRRLLCCSSFERWT